MEVGACGRTLGHLDKIWILLNFRLVTLGPSNVNMKPLSRARS